MVYNKQRYLETRSELPRMQTNCGVCGKKLEKFGERKQIYFCSDECANEHKKKYRKEWDKQHIEKVRSYRKKYYDNQKNKTPKL